MGRLKQFDPEAAVAAATDLFWRQGYGATTPADLVGALGIGKGSLYNTFDNKRALFGEALRHYGDARVAALVAVLNRPGPVRARLQAALERLAAPEIAHLRRRGCLGVNTVAELGGRDEAATAIVHSIFERMERALQAAIEEGQRNGELDAGRDARELASLLMTTILGMTVIAKMSDRTEQLHRVVHAVMSLI
ncbi:TetR/AcrR family transcriptional regulator [Mesorhizobium sp.]|uniref:TetR/AcrR family transcriptional regulator n=1 Tax=Mesorhizobium sp. TaxID=1871066 RepID=UPI0011FB7854|nr:TetR/AcrR family transcriptional regulator [Mesorhizobium sp.]TIS57559.1 MAG: TetR/AcrR family transcriptional regulator [Mesorhizobium sp.]TIS88663.1 MAG: TetR/AcrR family transcriptional regulator [Mesorhizobium sp.]